jgi:hypothetical protein
MTERGVDDVPCSNQPNKFAGSCVAVNMAEKEHRVEFKKVSKARQLYWKTWALLS